MLAPIALVGTCIGSLWSTATDTKELAHRTMQACTPSVDAQACAEATGIEGGTERRARLISYLATLTQEHGAYTSMSARGYCGHASSDRRVKELRAEVQFERGTESMAFRWEARDDRWVLVVVTHDALDTECG